MATVSGLHLLPGVPLGASAGFPEVIFACFVILVVPQVESSGLCFTLGTNSWSNPRFLIWGSADGCNVINALTDGRVTDAGDVSTAIFSNY